MKNKIILLIVGCISLLLSSCLGSDNTSYEVSKDCQILSFSLSNDSIDGLSDVVFTIDQINGKIFNMDSMPYGTVIDEKVICNITLASTVLSCQVIPLATGDTIQWNKEDSLDFSKPVKFINTLWDGITTKLYQAQINIHQVDPDSMVWSLYGEDVFTEPMKDEKVIVSPINGTDYYYMYGQTALDNSCQLYVSSVSDGKNWRQLTVSGLPSSKIILSQITTFLDSFYIPTTDGTLYVSADGQNWTLQSTAPVVRYILGSIEPSEDYTSTGRQQASLSTIIEKDGFLYFASMDKDQSWTEGLEVYDGFPLTGFGSTRYNSMYRDRLILIGGRDKNNDLVNLSWSTEDGSKWALLTDEEATYFDPMEGMSLAPYDSGLFVVGGINAANEASKAIYLSRDGGISWTLSDSLVVMSPDFTARGFMSIYIDENKYMNLFGGKVNRNNNVLNQIWRGRINRLGFINQ